MDTKNRSEKTSLLNFYKTKPRLKQGLVAIVLAVAQLFVMYLIQNNFESSRFMALGLVLLVISLFVNLLLHCIFVKGNGDGR